MKYLKRILAFVLSVMMLFQLVGCKSNNANTEKKITGATVFCALRDQMHFDSKLTKEENPHKVIKDLPHGSDVTLLTGPDQFSDQLGIVEVENEDDLDDAEKCVNKYLQDMYNCAFAQNPEKLRKFEKIAIWKYELCIIFCITLNYKEAMNIIDRTIKEETGQTPETTAPTTRPIAPRPTEPIPSEPSESKPTEPKPTVPEVIEPMPNDERANLFSGKWEVSGHPVVRDAYENAPEDEKEFMSGFFELAFSPAGVTVSSNGEAYTFSTYEITEVHNYPCLLIEHEGDKAGFISINSDMLALIEYVTSYENDDPTIYIQGTKCDVEFFPFATVFMREGSGTAETPENINWGVYGELEFDADEISCFYYPTSHIVHIFEKNSQGRLTLVGAFYVYDSGLVEYIERMSLIGATNLPSDSIYTNHNFVITDNK